MRFCNDACRTGRREAEAQWQALRIPRRGCCAFCGAVVRKVVAAR